MAFILGSLISSFTSLNGIIEIHNQDYYGLDICWVYPSSNGNYPK